METSKSFFKVGFSFLSVALSGWGLFPHAQAVQVDWKGQFWTDHNWISNYQLDASRPATDADATYYDAGGPYVPGSGEKNASWFTAFLRLQPKIIVNDSVHINSEWYVGSPVNNYFGRGFGQGPEDRYSLLGSQKQGTGINAMRFWASVYTDLGTFEMGRVPIQWGLGAIWNEGSGLFQKFQSSGDMVRFTTKIGNFSLSPAFSRVVFGDNISGTLNSSAVAYPSMNTTRPGSDDVTDIHLSLLYSNTEEDFDLGAMWTRRYAIHSGQKQLAGSPSASDTKINLNLVDVYARKKWNRWTVGLEVPVVTGQVSALDGSDNRHSYKSLALIAEGQYESDTFLITGKVGHVPGQAVVGNDSVDSSLIDSGSKYTALYLNRNYGLGLLMFHYNMYGFSANNPDTIVSTQSDEQKVRSPYDAPITNANYLAVSPSVKLEKWTLGTTLVAAFADQSAPGGRSGSKFYNHQRHKFYNLNAAAESQSKFLGWEWDFSAKYKWDESLELGWTTGFWFPGSYYAWTNLPNQTLANTGFVFGSLLQAGISF